MLNEFTDEITTQADWAVLSSIRILSSAETLAQQPMLLTQVYRNYCIIFNEIVSSNNYSLAMTPESVKNLLGYVVIWLGKHIQ